MLIHYNYSLKIALKAYYLSTKVLKTGMPQSIQANLKVAYLFTPTSREQTSNLCLKSSTSEESISL